MMQMRPFQIVVFAVFALLAIAGIFVFATYSGISGRDNKIGTVVIWGTLPEDAISDALARVREDDPNFSGVTYEEMRPETFDTDLANALASGTGPDLILISQEQLMTELPRIETIPFSSLPQRTFLDSYVAIDQLFLSANGSYGVPFLVDPLVLYYNRPMLAAVGAAEAPKTWEAVAGLVPSVTKLDQNQTVIKSTLPFGSYANVVNARAILSLLFLQVGSSITSVTEGEVRGALSRSGANGSTGNSGPEAALNFYTQFANPSRTLYSWNASLPSSRQEFLAGDLALYFGFASERTALKAGNPNLDFDMAAIPQSGTATSRTTYGLAYAFAIPKISQNKSGAYLAAFELTDSAYLGEIAEKLGMAPAKRALLAPDPADIYAPVFYPEALNAKGWLSPAPTTVDGIFSGMISNVTSGRMEASQALSNADQSLDAAL